MSETVGTIEDLLKAIGITEADDNYLQARAALKKRDVALHEHLNKKVKSEYLDDETQKLDLKRLEKEISKRDAEIEKLKEESLNLESSPAVQKYIKSKMLELEAEKKQIMDQSKHEVETNYKKELESMRNFALSEKAKRQKQDLLQFGRRYSENVDNPDILAEMLVNDGLVYMKEIETPNGIQEIPAMKPIKVLDKATGTTIEQSYEGEKIGDGIKAVLQSDYKYSKLFRFTENINAGIGTTNQSTQPKQQLSDDELARQIATGKIRML